MSLFLLMLLYRCRFFQYEERRRLWKKCETDAATEKNDKLELIEIAPDAKYEKKSHHGHIYVNLGCMGMS